MILMIDNYDSFTYNLVQYLREMAAEVRVFRNDAITVAEIEKLAPAAIVLAHTGPDPTEVKTHHLPIGLHQGAGEGLHHFVVHGAAVQGMGVGHHGDPFGAARWAVAHRLHRANHAIEGDFFGLRDHLHGLAAQVLRDAQAFHDAAIFEVGFNNLVDVRFIDKAVPHAFGIDHADRGGRAAV